MATFTYLGRDERGARVKGLMEAIDARALAQRLSRMGYTVTRIEETGGTPRAFDLNQIFVRVRPRDLIGLYLQLGTMLGAGIPLSVALGDLRAETDNARIATALEDVSRRVEQGESLSKALKAHRRVFTPLTWELAEAGESTGRLDEAFIGLAGYVERDEEILAQVRAALRYPSLVLAAAIIVVGATFAYVLPNFALVFSRMDAELPVLTRAVLAAGSAIRDDGLIFLAGFTLAGLVAAWAARREGVAAWLDGLRLRLPAVGSLLRKMVIARFARTLGVLVAAGIPILQALGTSARVMGNRKLRSVVEAAAEEVRRGKGLAETLAKTGEFPAPVVRIIGVGERTGRLEDLLRQVSEHYEREIPYTVKRLTTFLEVTMILLMGGLVALIAFAFLMPMAMILDLV